jgi:hypothetical protein
MKIQKPRTKISKKIKILRWKMKKNQKNKSPNKKRVKKWKLRAKLNGQSKMERVRRIKTRDPNMRVSAILTRRNLKD